MEVVVPPERNEFLVNFIEKVFTPVEEADWKVEAIRMHPKDFAVFREKVGKQFDVEVNTPALKLGILGYLFGAAVIVKRKHRRHHYEVVYGSASDLTNVVCLRKNEVTGEDCPDLNCVVDAVHDL